MHTARLPESHVTGVASENRGRLGPAWSFEIAFDQLMEHK
jgi:hypothetical protein